MCVLYFSLLTIYIISIKIINYNYKSHQNKQMNKLCTLKKNSCFEFASDSCHVSSLITENFEAAFDELIIAPYSL